MGKHVCFKQSKKFFPYSERGKEHQMPISINNCFYHKYIRINSSFCQFICIQKIISIFVYCTEKIYLIFQVFTMSLCGEKFVVGTAGRKVYVWDLRNMGYVNQRRESSLKYQTRCIKCFPNKQVSICYYCNFLLCIGFNYVYFINYLENIITCEYF